MAKRKIRFHDREIDGVDVPFRIVDDGHVVLETEEGTRLRVRPVILNVIRTDEMDPVTEERLYVVQHVLHVLTEPTPSAAPPAAEET